MALSKKFLKTKPICKVTFSYKAPKIKEIVLVGDFNNWDATATPLKKLKNGTFKVVVDVEIDKNYEYKFLSDGNYFNDSEADDLVFNDYANTKNSLLKV